MYNLKDYITEANKAESKKPILNINVNVPSLDGILLNTPNEITSVATAGLNARVGALITIGIEFQIEMNKLSNSDNLQALSKIINKKDLPEIKIDGYNYTNLDKVITLKNPYMQIIDFLEESHQDVLDIAKSDISDGEKAYKINKLNPSIEFKLVDFGYNNNTTLPQYYRDDADCIQSLVIKDCKKIYTDLKSIKRYTSLVRGYNKILTEETALVNKSMKDPRILELYNTYSVKTDVGKAINRVIIAEGKCINAFSEIMTTAIYTQLSEIKDSLKQDINILNNLVKEYKNK